MRRSRATILLDLGIIDGVNPTDPLPVLQRGLAAPAGLFTL
jgi:hypothetical protein